jgi:hypothetical protein
VTAPQPPDPRDLPDPIVELGPPVSTVPWSPQFVLQSIEILPLEAPLTVFVWGRNRIVPVRITELSVTEEAFDTSLNPTRAKVSLGMRVLTVDDVGFQHRGGALYLLYQQGKETFAQGPSGPLTTLGITAIPGGS